MNLPNFDAQDQPVIEKVTRVVQDLLNTPAATANELKSVLKQA